MHANKNCGQKIPSWDVNNSMKLSHFIFALSSSCTLIIINMNMYVIHLPTIMFVIRGRAPMPFASDDSANRITLVN